MIYQPTMILGVTSQIDVYIDTSAFLAVLNRNDDFHFKAKSAWTKLLDSNAKLVINSFVLMESCVLIQNRLGINALKTFIRHIQPILFIDWIEENSFHTSIYFLSEMNERSLSLVDCSSFYTMTRLHISTVFTFDSYFLRQGFEIYQNNL